MPAGLCRASSTTAASWGCFQVGGWAGNLPETKNTARGASGGSATGPKVLQVSPDPAQPSPAQRGWALLAVSLKGAGQSCFPSSSPVSMVMLHSTVLSSSGFISLQIRQPVLIHCSLGSGAWQQGSLGATELQWLCVEVFSCWIWQWMESAHKNNIWTVCCGCLMARGWRAGMHMEMCILLFLL